MPMISKPILLFYAFEKLAEIAILNTFTITTSTYSHGLTYDRETLNVKVSAQGLFPRLHDCYSSNPAFCGKKYEFKLDSLMNTEPIGKTELLTLGNPFESVSVHEETTRNPVLMGEPDREFLFIYALSILARYRVNDWSDVIEVKNDTRILRIRRYTQSIQMYFPNWILDALSWKRHLFYEKARFG